MVYQNIINKKQYKSKEDVLEIRTIDMHTCGEPLRVIIDGYPEIKGKTILEKRRYCLEELDHLRTALMFEPRGHADMYGCLLTEPNDETGDFGIIFMHNEGYSTMCGHAIIAIASLAVEMEWVEKSEGKNTIQIDAPCGRIEAHVSIKNGEIEEVNFLCVPSFVAALDQTIDHDTYGKIVYDLAYGGAFYAYVDLKKNNFDFGLEPHDYRKIIQVGKEIKQEVIKNGFKTNHPFEKDLSFLYGTIFIDAAKNNKYHSRNVCVFADGEVDRCPTGSGLSGRMAIHHARKDINPGQIITVESIIDTIFHGKVEKEVSFGAYTAVVPRVSGTAHVTGSHHFYIDPKDPLSRGFLLH